MVSEVLLPAVVLDTFFMRVRSVIFSSSIDGATTDRQGSQLNRSTTVGFPRNHRSAPCAERLNKKCLLSNPDLAKARFLRYQNLTALIDARYAPVDFPTKPSSPCATKGSSRHRRRYDAYPSIPLVASYHTAGGASLVAYWLPCNAGIYAETRRITLFSAGMKFTDRCSSICSTVRAFAPPPRDENGGAVFADLPLFDFPLIVVERSEVPFVRTARRRLTIGAK